MQLRNFFSLLLAGALGGGVTVATYELSGLRKQEEAPRDNMPAFTRLAPRGDGENGRLPDGFGNAVQHSLQQVVHIKAAARAPSGNVPDYYQLPEPFRHFFGIDPREGQPLMELRCGGSHG